MDDWDHLMVSRSARVLELHEQERRTSCYSVGVVELRGHVGHGFQLVVVVGSALNFYVLIS